MLSKLLIPIVLVFTSLADAGVELLSFRAIPLIDHSRLEWNSGEETNLDAFIVERSSDGQSFMAVTRIESNGSYSEYSFTDSSPLDVDMNRSFYYRLKIVDHDGTFRYSETKEVTLTFSAVQQTWGSIKAMFR